MSLTLYSEKKRASVTFAGDEDVGKHITSLNSLCLKQRTRKTKRTYYVEDDSDPEIGEVNPDDDDACEADVYKPSDALADDEALPGDKVFGFRASKANSQMSKVAAKSVEAATPTTPKKHPTAGSLPTTPKSILTKTRGVSQVLTETGQTPTTKRTSRRIKQLATLTPQRLSTRIKLPNHESSSEESVFSESSESDTSPDRSKQTPTKTNTPVKKRMTKNNKDIDVSVKTDKVEAYFEAHCTSNVVTSDHTLSRLNMPRLDHEALAQVLSGLEAQYEEERHMLLDNYRTQFDKWMFLLCHGYNLVFHGLGSKRSLLEEFREKMLSNFSHVLVNGYFPSLTIRNILNAITEDIMEHTGHFKSPIEQCTFIQKNYDCGDYQDFYLVIHNIDGVMLRGDKTQTILSLLAQIRGFHIIASIDHINAPLMWDSVKCSRFNWLWFDVTTYESYSEETSYENSLLIQQSGALALSSLLHVIRSLTPNAKGIFMLLVRHQLEHGKDNAGYQGLSFAELYQKCREAFLVNSDLTLNTQLTEFKDHKLIKLKKGADGIEYLLIPLDNATLNEFLQQQESEET